MERNDHILNFVYVGYTLIVVATKPLYIGQPVLSDVGPLGVVQIVKILNNILYSPLCKVFYWYQLYNLVSSSEVIST